MPSLRFETKRLALGFGLYFVDKLSRDCEASEMVARFDPTYAPDPAELDCVRYEIERWHREFNLNLCSYRRAILREYKHSATPYVFTLPHVVMSYAVSPAE
jgi:hypothetical protein